MVQGAPVAEHLHWPEEGGDVGRRIALDGEEVGVVASGESGLSVLQAEAVFPGRGILAG
jgi:hypothetical protein